MTDTVKTVSVILDWPIVRTVSAAIVVPPAGSGGGTSGLPGLSAYEVAVADDIVGTPSDWLASLQGAPGADGAAGADNQAGAPGQSVTITIFTDQAAYDAYTPGALELAVLKDA